MAMVNNMNGNNADNTMSIRESDSIRVWFRTSWGCDMNSSTRVQGSVLVRKARVEGNSRPIKMIRDSNILSDMNNIIKRGSDI